MAGKRSWYVIRKYLMQAAEDKMAKGASLADILYIPESFNAEKKNEITQRRIAHMGKAAATVKGSRRLMIVIGVVKEVAQSRYGHKIVFKHLPDCHFMMNDDLHKRLLKRFEVELGLWDALEDTPSPFTSRFSSSGSRTIRPRCAAAASITRRDSSRVTLPCGTWPR